MRTILREQLCAPMRAVGRQTAPPPDSTFAIQTYSCFSFIEYVPWQKCFIFNEIVNKIPDNFTCIPNSPKSSNLNTILHTP